MNDPKERSAPHRESRRRIPIVRKVLPDGALPTECDLVMKGGITSGIVYPRAIAEFARRFRLRSIGGASAGAIAAAAAAAAQYGRNNGCDRFDELEQLPEWLAGDEGMPHTRLLRLFQPRQRLRPLYRWLLGGLSESTYSRWRTALRWALLAARRFPLPALAGLVIALAMVAGLRGCAGLPLWPSSHTGVVLLGALGVLALMLGGCAGVLRALTRTVPRHFYGICDGMPHDADGAPALTPWLHGLLQRLAGRDRSGAPLTFGDLWGPAGTPRGRRRHPGATRTSARDIDLRVMTTALSQGRPYSLPFEPKDRFHFDETEFRQLFPADVVDWLLAHPAAVRDARMRLPGLHPLPEMEHLPILVAARMSLSFPLLICAVPLYRCHPVTREKERVWFSDGGLCSNFPVHYFDAPLPSRPTFAINLTDDVFLPRDREPAEPGDFVFVPEHNAGGQDHHVVDLEPKGRPRLGGFIGALLETLHNWTDNTQLRVPGFRDRVAHVRLRRNEGGLNLRMQRELILQLAERGRHAAKRLVGAFFPRAEYEHDTTWQNHRWVRFRTSFTLLEEALAGVLASHRRFAGQDTSIEALHAEPPSYPYTPPQAQRSLAAYGKIIALARELARLRGRRGSVFDPPSSPAPKPRSQLRIRPRM